MNTGMKGWQSRAWAVGYFTKAGAATGWVVGYAMVSVRVLSLDGMAQGLGFMASIIAPDTVLCAVAGAVIGVVAGFAVRIDDTPEPFKMNVRQLRRALIDEKVAIFKSELKVLRNPSVLSDVLTPYDKRVVGRLRKRISDARWKWENDALEDLVQEDGEES